jgi:threonine synthase
VIRFISSRGGSPPVGFRTALFEGIAPDGGLYVPERLDPLPLEDLRGGSLVDVAAVVVGAFVGDEIPRPQLERLLQDALSFPVPLVAIDDRTFALELFHGPTFAFKDVGARVMARLMAHFSQSTQPLTVLVATSGDTGSAVAQAFHGVPGTRVIVLFPETGVTPVQDAQFTTLGGNVTAVAVAGTFDACQRLAKAALADPELQRRAGLTSANSINIGRLTPQLVYYVHAALQLRRPGVFSVPSGNFGNLTAGLFASKLGAPIHKFIAATTVNDTLPRYLRTGRYEPRPSVATLANAMDVGDPSNVERMRWLFDDDLAAMRQQITASAHTDADVRLGIKLAWDRHGYICDPHSAIGYLGLAAADAAARDVPRVFLATAHPAKFRETVEPVLGQPVPLPAALADALNRPRFVQRIESELSQLAEFL